MTHCLPPILNISTFVFRLLPPSLSLFSPPANVCFPTFISLPRFSCAVPNLSLCPSVIFFSSQVLSPCQSKTLLLLLLLFRALRSPLPPPLCFLLQTQTDGHLRGHVLEALRPTGMLESPLALTCHWTLSHHLCGGEVDSLSVLLPVAKVRF